MNNEIILAHVAPDESPAQPNHNHENPEHVHTGKIGRLPGHLRDEVNLRLYNGNKGTDILAWLVKLSRAAVFLAKFRSAFPSAGPASFIGAAKAGFRGEII